MKNLMRILLFAALGAALVLFGRWSASVPESSQGVSSSEAPSTARGDVVWTCPMHPQVRLPEPVPCPVCGMDLVAMLEDADSARMAFTPEEVRLAGIETSPVERRLVTRVVRMAGKVDFDETAMRTITARAGGYLERLFVDYTGVRVEAGDHLVRFYSPELLTAQEELLSAKARVDATAGEASQFLAESNQRTYRTAREKLVLLGLAESQVDAIEARGTVEEKIVLESPASGVVVRKAFDEGAYVQPGMPIYSIADLSHLWVRLDAYERDLTWLRFGQRVTIEAEALPGEEFEGTISFLDPVLDERTRTVKVRVNLDNADGRLKPGMFVRGSAFARVGAEGRVLGRSLAGKWVSPMHPEVVKDDAGACDVCGMDLVPAESLGLVGGMGVMEPIVVPATAVLVTGKRAVVYVEIEGEERPTYEGRTVVLGVRAGDEYIIRSGLEAGERVVTHGAFRIDSSMQIRAKPSMMSQPGGASLEEGE